MFPAVRGRQWESRTQAESLFFRVAPWVPMETLGPRPRDLTIRSEREVDRRVRLSTFAIFVAFLFGSLGFFGLLSVLGAQAYSGLAYILVLAAYGSAFGYLLWRSGRRELAMNRLTAVFMERLPVGVTFVDAEAKIVFANEAMATGVLGGPASDILGRPAVEIIHPADRPRVVDELQRRRGGAISTYEARVLRRDGLVKHVVITATPFMDRGQFD